MSVPYITSITNPQVMHVASLHTKKGRDAAGLFIAEGLRTCSTLATSHVRLQRVYVLKDFRAAAESFAPRELITEVTVRIMEKMSTSSSPSGIVGLFAIPTPAQLLQPLHSGIVLAQISDPGNMGTLIRTAAALHLDGVVVIEGADIWSPKVVQASAGTVGQIPLYNWAWDELKRHLPQVKLAALVVTAGTAITELDYTQPRLFVVGNEAHGLPAAWQAVCDERVTLPMPGGVESLNAAVAGSIALYVAYLHRT